MDTTVLSSHWAWTSWSECKQNFLASGKLGIYPAEATPIENCSKARTHYVRPSMNSRNPSNFSADFEKPFYAILNAKESEMHLTISYTSRQYIVEASISGP
jgi:hypothetical protein